MNNLIPGFDCDSWSNWSPRKSLRPDFRKVILNGQTLLEISSKDSYDAYGKWQCRMNGIEGGVTYRFSFEYLFENVLKDNMSIFVLVTWLSTENDMLTRDYVDEASLCNDGWKCFQRTIDAPEGSAAAVVELTFRWSENGAVMWRNPIVEMVSPVGRKKIKAATTYLKPHFDLKMNLEAMLGVIDRAGAQGADIICLSEVYYDRGVPLAFHEIEAVPGNLTCSIAEKAKLYNTYIVLCMKERDGDRLYVTAVLFDRKGRITGKYRKTHIPLCEAEEGFSPGREYPVFDTDFGKVGILICFDHWFPESARQLRANGAEIIFIPTIGDAPLQSRARAADNGIYVVVCGAGGPECSRIIGPDGEIIGEVEDEAEGVCIREIDLNKRFYQYWYSVGPAYGEPRSIVIKELRTDTYGY